MKMLALIAILFSILSLSFGCSSTPEHRQHIVEGAAICNTTCQDNPEISEYSFKVGGGMPLIFFGGVEQKCACNRRN